VLWPLRWALRVVVGLVVLCLVVFAWTALRVWRTGLTDSRPRSDAIVVEGAAQYDGRPSAVLEARLAHALDLYHAGVAPRIVTVGGRRTGDRFTEAGAGRTWLLGRGVPAGSVVAVEQRSRAIARDLGLRADSSPVTEGPATRGLGTQVRYVGRESVAYLYYRLFHRASRAGPSAV